METRARLFSLLFEIGQGNLSESSEDLAEYEPIPVIPALLLFVMANDTLFVGFHRVI